MKPYYETELGKLYHGDCLEIMPELEIVDLVLTDPPYGINVAKNGYSRAKGDFFNGKWIDGKNYGIQEWDSKPPPKEWFEMITSLTNNQIIFGGNYFIEWLKNSSCWIVWDKDNGENRNADCELAWTSFETAVRKITWRWNGMFKESPETRYHPTQKPVGLFMQILDKYSELNDLILDPFLGSGTTAIACERLNRRWIGIEISKKYCEIAAKRIENERKQLKMF